jgi:hypothetical protein
MQVAVVIVTHVGALVFFNSHGDVVSFFVYAFTWRLTVVGTYKYPEGCVFLSALPENTWGFYHYSQCAG